MCRALLPRLALAAITIAPASLAQAKIEKKTFAYKTVGTLAIKADVYRAPDSAVRPVVVWIHGGALIMGGREGINRRVQQMFLEAGYALVSIDYRLAPETKLPAIVEDVEDDRTEVALSKARHSCLP